nr:hypothetical protein [Tanacetum cinerariifolium]
MASLHYRLNPINTIKECSSSGALYNKSCGCSKGSFVDKFVRDPNKTPDSSQRPPHNCPKCENPVDGLYCRQCALLRKKLKEVWFTICDENEIFQDFLYTFESSNDNTNVVNAPQEPFIFNQDPDDIFYQRCTCESCGNGAQIGYNCPPKVLIISNPEPCYNQNVDEFPQTLPSFHLTCYSGDENSFTYDSNLNFMDDSPNTPPQPLSYSYEFCGNDAHYGHDYLQQRMNDPMIELRETFQTCLQQQVVNLYSYTPEPSQCRKIPIYYDDDDDEESSTPLRDVIISKLPSCIAIVLVLTTKDPKDSRIIGDEHLDTIPEKESDEFIISSVQNLVPSLSESEDISDNSLIISSPKIDYLLEEFFGELAHIDLIPSGINEADFDPEEEIHLVEKLLYDNSSSRPSKEVNSKNSYAIIESFSSSPIPVEDSDSLMEEINLFLTLDDSMPPGIKNDDYDFKRDILFL